MEVTEETASATPETETTETPSSPREVIPPSERPQTSVEREAQLLTPVEVDHGKPLYRQVLPGVMQVPAETVLALVRKSSLWPLTFGLACCAIEMIATYMSHYDLDRFGIFPQASPRQADVMIVAGTVTKKEGPGGQRASEHSPNPKRVISMGPWAKNGGPYTRDARGRQGVDKLMPVDIYVPGCPPRPEALMDGFMALQHKIMEERGKV